MCTLFEGHDLHVARRGGSSISPRDADRGAAGRSPLQRAGAPKGIARWHSFGGYFAPAHAGSSTATEPFDEEITITELIDRPTAQSPRPDDRGTQGRPRPWIAWAIAALLLWLLVGPRLELAGAHGLRVEDFVFALLAVLCFVGGGARRRPSSVSVALFGVVATGLVSSVVALSRGMVEAIPSFLFALRPLEYWIAFPAAVLLLRTPGADWRRRTERLLTVVTVLQFLFAVAQYYFDLPIGFSHVSYDRAAGLTVGPYELGAISAALVVFWVARGRLTMASIAVIALATSISRISIIGAAVALVLFVAFWSVSRPRGRHGTDRPVGVRTSPRERWRFAGQLASVLTAGVVLALTVGLIHLPTGGSTAGGSAAPVDPAPAATVAATPTAPDDDATDGSDGGTDGDEQQSPAPTTTPSAVPDDAPAGPTGSIAKRFATTSIVGSWNASTALAAAVPPVHTSAEYQDVAYARLWDFVRLDDPAAAGTEASNLVRFFRWHLILNTIDTPADVLFGLGPSFVGVSVDGSYLRFLADGGLLGVLAWLVLILTWFRRTPLWMKCVTVSYLVGALFIDIVYAQRPMVLFWLLLALALTAQKRRVAALPVSSAAD